MVLAYKNCDILECVREEWVDGRWADGNNFAYCRGIQINNLTIEISHIQLFIGAVNVIGIVNVEYRCQLRKSWSMSLKIRIERKEKATSQQNNLCNLCVFHIHILLSLLYKLKVLSCYSD